MAHNLVMKGGSPLKIFHQDKERDSIRRDSPWNRADWTTEARVRRTIHV